MARERFINAKRRPIKVAWTAAWAKIGKRGLPRDLAVNIQVVDNQVKSAKK